ncbi:MAG: hypothetical protein JNK43_05490 [Ignavibacteria bacterium]|nr:hypothetical protein [Ignavibacteria bacterium]
MMNLIRNSFSIIIALLILSGGNFVYALAHGDCIIGEHGHTTCEMECCKTDPCADDEADGTVKIVDESSSCCKTHIGQAAQQDTPVLTHAEKTFVSKFIVNTGDTKITLPDTGLFRRVIHKFKTTNILLSTSILRI